MKLLISLHDITPFHQARILKAEKYFAEWGIQKITYLFVPEFHHENLASENAEFKTWCVIKKSFAIDWYLHGYHHLETIKNGAGQRSDTEKKPTSLSDTFKRKVLTGGEGEFLALDEESIREKISSGAEVFNACLGFQPQGFVAPAWLFNSRLLPVLKEKKIAFTEDQRFLYRTDTGIKIASPVITWATRTWLRKYGSLIVCPTLARMWTREPILRIAMHPHDFDHPATITSIYGVLKYAMKNREQVFSNEIDF